MESTLAWTKYGTLEDETTLLDPLAFDYFAQLLGNVVLPSFTTRTSRARYYSMVCYGLYISEQYLQRKGNICYEKEILEAFKLYERYWARAVVEHYGGNLYERDGREREFRGKRGALRAYQEENQSLNYRFLTRQLELGGLGAYRSSLEDLELIKEDLRLTHKGRTLAENFVNMSIYDKLVLRAMKEEKIVPKEGKGSLASFGFHAMLDGTISEEVAKYFVPYHQEEIRLLKEYILEHPRNNTALTYIYQNRSAGNALEIVEQIARQNPRTDRGKQVVLGFRTILAFEELAIILNRIWCAIIRTAEEHLGKITVEQAVAGCREYLDQLSSSNSISMLLNQREYRKIVDSYHGLAFASLLNSFQTLTEPAYGAFLLEMTRYLDGNEIIVTTGYDYPTKTEKLEFLHGYKISNMLTLMEDTGWEPGAEVY